MTSDDNKTVEEKVDELQSVETFSFMELLQGRGFPKDSITVYLDEAAAYELQKAETASAHLEDGPELEASEKRISALQDTLRETAYVFKLTGVSTELKEDLLEVAHKQFPSKYDQAKNFMTGSVEKVEKDNPDRDRYFASLLYQAHTEQIVAPDGKVDTTPSVETIGDFLRKGPAAQVHKYIGAINKLQLTSNVFEETTNEDFLAKS